MADTRISNLTAGTPTTTDEGVYTNGTTTYKFDMSTAKDAILNPGSTTGQKLAVIGSGSAGFIDDDFEINYIIGNAGTTAITQTGMYPYFRVNFAGTIEGMEMMSGTIAGNGTIDIWKGNYTTPPTTTAQTIIGTSLLSFTGGTKYQGTPSGWGTSTFSAGDIFSINLSGAATISFLSVMLHGRKTAVS